MPSRLAAKANTLIWGGTEKILEFTLHSCYSESGHQVQAHVLRVIREKLGKFTPQHHKRAFARIRLIFRLSALEYSNPIKRIPAGLCF